MIDTTIEKRIQILRELRDIQGMPGNYDTSDYMRGMYNGIELALSVVEDREPEFKEAAGE